MPTLTLPCDLKKTQKFINNIHTVEVFVIHMLGNLEKYLKI